MYCIRYITRTRQEGTRRFGLRETWKLKSKPQTAPRSDTLTTSLGRPYPSTLENWDMLQFRPTHKVVDSDMAPKWRFRQGDNGGPPSSKSCRF